MSHPEAVLGFDIGGQSIKAALVDSNGGMIAQATAPTGEAMDCGGLVDALTSLTKTLLGSRRGGDTVGVGIAGVIDRGGVVHGAPHLPLLIGHRLERELGQGLGAAVVVHNDADCAALAEAWTGAARGRDDFLLLTLGTGVGSGLMLGGKLRRGDSGYGCEFGHMIVVHDGRPCGCGNRGCLEAYVSETAARRWTEQAPASLRDAVAQRIQARGGAFAQALFELGGDGNAEAEEVVGRMVDVLGTAIASAVNVLDLSCIVLGGGIAPGILARVLRLRAAMGRSLFARNEAAVELLAASAGPWAGAIGAARGAMLG